MFPRVAQPATNPKLRLPRPRRRRGRGLGRGARPRPSPCPHPKSNLIKVVIQMTASPRAPRPAPRAPPWMLVVRCWMLDVPLFCQTRHEPEAPAPSPPTQEGERVGERGPSPSVALPGPEIQPNKGSDSDDSFPSRPAPRASCPASDVSCSMLEVERSPFPPPLEPFDPFDEEAARYLAECTKRRQAAQSNPIKPDKRGPDTDESSS